MRQHPAFVCAQCTRLTRSIRWNVSPFSLPSTKRLNSHATQTGRLFRVAIVGSGPAGFYAASHLLAKQQDAVVDMYEKLPVPFGLVRYGVAPDHPEVKNCEEKFTEVATSSRFNFVGNIALGHDLPLAALKPHYDAILFAYGAARDKGLGIPGEEPRRNVYSARAFVGWYNGLPDHRDLEPDLTSGEDAVIIGHGNVALDVARILLSDVDALRKTDISDYALAALAQSRIKRVRVVGRRGPLQASFTIKEVRELLQLPSVSFEPIPKELFPPEETISALPRAQKRLIQLLAKGSTNNPETSSKSWSLQFCLSPSSFEMTPDASQVARVQFDRNYIEPANPYSRSSKAIPEYTESGQPARTNLPASIVFRSVGYRSLPLPNIQDLGIEFDELRGVIPNDGVGRVTTLSGSVNPQNFSAGSPASHLPGLYCAGWVKTGPTGVIASTMADAFTTADAIYRSGLGGVKPEAERLGLRRTSWQDWQRIDEKERALGKETGRPRAKLGRVSAMLEALD
ncbi:hypothetical protein NUU61_010112 [Penicillium alfredii]|uniref:NADPH:adrenodoxin oxidoreductase, mitochondrial n=1 Tax=Penicillium alfredii TaxID=1506179 RepID=A0A9W9EHD3_9EURO|nr:uncharacterized protein NUU61_010112 [Penicillium alfredii]KAJ5081848.1 hypothetical protein NUU61_010112 [Penicillium alfredii]